MTLFFSILFAALDAEEDRELAVRLQRRDPQALAELYDRYGRVAFSLIVVLFFVKQMPKWLRPIVVTFPLSMMTTLVYFGEHFVFDGIMGVAYVLIAFRFWNRYERSRGISV